MSGAGYQPLRRADLRADLASLEAQAGAWTAHNLELAPGLFTKGPGPSGEELKLRRVAQLVADLSSRPSGDLRVIDLGALEGLYGIELALGGAEVVFVEGRQASADKIQFAIDALGLRRASVRTQDVRLLSRAEHGEFDVVLCIGLLYHLEQEGLFEVIRRMREVSSGFVVVDTHIALEDDEIARYGPDAFWVDPRTLSKVREFEVDGRRYRGRDFVEHAPESTQEERIGSAWASLDNQTSLWLTRPSLTNALMAGGFTSVLECTVPPLPGLPPDRVTLVAKAGERIRLKSSSVLADVAFEALPERSGGDDLATESPGTEADRSVRTRLGRVIAALQQMRGRRAR
jgi:Methyltransferase domain